MKTKLSFLALPLCAGLVLTFALAACSTSGGGEVGGQSASGGGNSSTSSASAESPQYEPPGDGGIEVMKMGDKIYMLGQFRTRRNYKIASLKFDKAWVKHNGTPVAANTVIPIDSTEVLDLQNENFYIDLENVPSCGQNEITVTVYHKPNAYATHTFKFDKPQEEYCPTSSTGGGGASSSSVKWKYGTRGTTQATNSGETSLGSSVRFTIREVVGSGGFSTYSISVVGGTARTWTNQNYLTDEFDDPGDMLDNQEFESNRFTFGSPVTMLNNPGDYYLITVGDTRYLIRIKEVVTSGSNWSMPILYWNVISGPTN